MDKATLYNYQQPFCCTHLYKINAALSAD